MPNTIGKLTSKFISRIRVKTARKTLFYSSKKNIKGFENGDYEKYQIETLIENMKLSYSDLYKSHVQLVKGLNKFMILLKSNINLNDET
jgi:diketogulonate reductase-like aldo/keto reductase